jgi:hypothetical protein
MFRKWTWCAVFPVYTADFFLRPTECRGANLMPWVRRGSAGSAGTRGCVKPVTTTRTTRSVYAATRSGALRRSCPWVAAKAAAVSADVPIQRRPSRPERVGGTARPRTLPEASSSPTWGARLTTLSERICRRGMGQATIESGQTLALAKSPSDRLSAAPDDQPAG